jgi:O-Antigen ligase
MNFKFTIHKIIGLLVLWQFISVGLMAVGAWPPQVAIVNALLLGIFILAAQPYFSVLLLIVSIPFFVILPNPFLENMPMWRILFIWLFVVWLVRLLMNQRAWLSRVIAIKRWNSDTPMTGARFREIVVNAIARVNSRLRPWDKVAVLFLILALCSLLIARFPMHGLKQIIYLVNVYLFYIVIVNVVTDESKLKEIIRYAKYSLLMIVGLGFLQYFSTLFSVPYYFWQYWATRVSSLYYGIPLGEVLTTSNSWFSDANGQQALRMFGILQDTHAFGALCIFLLAFLLPFFKGFKRGIQKWYWVAAIVATSFALMASGTRGVWISILGPAVIVALLYYKQIAQPFLKNVMIVYAIIVLMFAISPFVTQGLNLIRSYDVNDDFLNRASSIYDLSESSNLGRIEIWKNSAKFAALHPFGVGYGNFITSLVNNIPKNATYEKVSAMKNIRYNLPEGFITAHSLYLQLLVELGFAGLLAFILYWWEFFEWLWQFVKKHGENGDYYSNLTVSLGLAFVWLLTYGLFDVTILNDRVLQYLFISLAICGLIFAKYESFSKRDVEDIPQVVDREPTHESLVV